MRGGTRTKDRGKTHEGEEGKKGGRGKRGRKTPTAVQTYTDSHILRKETSTEPRTKQNASVTRALTDLRHQKTMPEEEKKETVDEAHIKTTSMRGTAMKGKRKGEPNSDLHTQDDTEM